MKVEPLRQMLTPMTDTNLIETFCTYDAFCNYSRAFMATKCLVHPTFEVIGGVKKLWGEWCIMFFPEEKGGTWKDMQTMRMRMETAVGGSAKANRRKPLSCSMHGL